MNDPIPTFVSRLRDRCVLQIASTHAKLLRDNGITHVVRRPYLNNHYTSFRVSTKVQTSLLLTSGTIKSKIKEITTCYLVGRHFINCTSHLQLLTICKTVNEYY